MANEKNLIPNEQRTPSERRENAQKAGIASGEARRRKKLLKECMIELLDLPVSNRNHWNKLSKMGINPDDIDNKELLTVALFEKAVSSGDVAAFKEIRNLIGEDVQTDENGQLEQLIEGLKTNE